MSDAKKRRDFSARDIERARQLSRRQYLSDREVSEMELLRRRIKAEEERFGTEQRTLREIAQLEKDKELLQRLERRHQLRRDTGGRRYVMGHDEEISEAQRRAQETETEFASRYAQAAAEEGEWDDLDAQRVWEKGISERVGDREQRKRRQKYIDKVRRKEREAEGDDRDAKRRKEDDLNEMLIDDPIDFVRGELLRRAEKKGVDANEALREWCKQESAKQNVELEDKRSKFDKIQAQRKTLPMYQMREDFLKVVEDNQIVVLVGETGSGKTTQIPQFLHEAGYSRDNKIVACTQPRRVAAMSVATRVAEEMGVRLGDECGYQIRFEDCTSEKTVVKYMTDGMMLRELIVDPTMAKYSCLVVDEAHERTLHTDVLFGIVKDLCLHRPDLKLIVASATLDAEKFANFFDGAPIFKVPGRTFPVDVYHTKTPEPDYLDAVVRTCLQIHLTQPLPGDILVFLTGQAEIEQVQETLQNRIRRHENRIPPLLIRPVYANLPADKQAEIFMQTPPGSRKVVLATNIAETSLTIDGVVYVVDTGFAKLNSFNPRSGTESLIVTPVSKASAKQRMGRAGRVAPGKCFRLYTKHAYQFEMEDSNMPEIQRTNLGGVVLLLKTVGINDLVNFDYIDPPPAEMLIKALEELYSLGALNDSGDLTVLGRQMAEFPLDPRISKMLIQSQELKCVDRVMTICAMLSTNAAIFYRPKDKKQQAMLAHKNLQKPQGDHITLLSLYEQWRATNYSEQWCRQHFVQPRALRRARDVREQLEGMLRRAEIMNDEDDNVNGDNMDFVCKAVVSGFFYQTAKLDRRGIYRTVGGARQNVALHPSSTLHDAMPPPKWIIYNEMVLTSKRFVRNALVIQPEWLQELAPHFFKKHKVGQEEQEKKAKVPRGFRKKPGAGRR